MASGVLYHLFNTSSVRTLSYAARGLLASIMVRMEDSHIQGVLEAPGGLSVASYVARETLGSPEEVGSLLGLLGHTGALVVSRKKIECPALLRSARKRKLGRERTRAWRKREELRNEAVRDANREKGLPPAPPSKERQSITYKEKNLTHGQRGGGKDREGVIGGEKGQGGERLKKSGFSLKSDFSRNALRNALRDAPVKNGHFSSSKIGLYDAWDDGPGCVENCVHSCKESEIGLAAQRVVDYYQKVVQPRHIKARGVKNVSILLRQRIKEEDLLRAADAYASHCRQRRVEPTYRMAVGNFYGQAAAYKEFMGQKNIDLAAMTPEEIWNVLKPLTVEQRNCLVDSLSEDKLEAVRQVRKRDQAEGVNGRREN